MRWWDLVAQKTKYRWIPMDDDGVQPWRVEASLACGLIGVGCFVAAIVAAVVAAFEVALWALVVGVPAALVSHFVLPTARSRR